MRKVIAILSFVVIITGCKNKQCLSKEFASFYHSEYYRNGIDSAMGPEYRQNYIKGRENLLSSICGAFNDENSVIIIEVAPFTSTVKKGILYLGQNNLIYNYSSKSSVNISVESGLGSLNYMAHLLDGLKSDYDNKIVFLIEKDKKNVVYDSGHLRIIKIDIHGKKLSEHTFTYDTSLLE